MTTFDATAEEVPVEALAAPASRRRFRGRRLPEQTVLLGLLAVLCAYFYVRQPLFGSGSNIQNLTSQSSVLAMMAAGQLFVILAGGIDISVGAQVSLLSIWAVDLSHQLPLGVALAATIALGCAIGLVNGILVAYVRISPIITTVATLQIMHGYALWHTNGLPRRNFSASYNALGANNIWFVPAATALAVLVFLAAWFLLARTKFGRYTYAVGGNAEAARLSGINVRWVTIGTYVVCSLFTALAAITLSSKVGSGLPDLGTGLEITTIAAVFIGGVAWGGGAGTAVGALLGVLLISILGNGLDLSAVSSNVQTIVTGVLMALAVGLTQLRRGTRNA
jgi:ribose transport system permease protein